MEGSQTSILGYPPAYLWCNAFTRWWYGNHHCGNRSGMYKHPPVKKCWSLCISKSSGREGLLPFGVQIKFELCLVYAGLIPCPRFLSSYPPQISLLQGAPRYTWPLSSLHPEVLILFPPNNTNTRQLCRTALHSKYETEGTYVMPQHDK